MNAPQDVAGDDTAADIGGRHRRADADTAVDEDRFAGQDRDEEDRVDPAGDGLGRTTVSERAVERIAARLVAECPDVGGTARRVLGVTVGAAVERDATVTARLHGTTEVSLAVRCSVPYPNPVRRATDTLRQLLLRQVPELTGLAVQRVDIDVTQLTTDAVGRRVQ